MLITGDNLEFKLFAELDRQLIDNELNMLYNHMKTAISGGTSTSQRLMEQINHIKRQGGGNRTAKTIRVAWGMLANLDASVELQQLDCRILTAHSLLLDSEMWFWFDVNVTRPTQLLATAPMSTLTSENFPGLPNEWILPIVTQVRIKYLAHLPITLIANEYLDITAPDYKSPATFRHPEEAFILRHVEAAVALWLDFHARPGTRLGTSRAIAKFISVACTAFNSANFLSLTHIQNGIKKLRSKLTIEGTPLDGIPWEQLAEELKAHPLADPSSDESYTLNCLAELMWSASGFLPGSGGTSIHYEKAKEAGGEAGIEILTQSLTQAHPICQETILNIPELLPSPQTAQDLPSPANSRSPTPTPQPLPPSQDLSRFSYFLSFLRAALDVVEEDANPLTLTQHRIVEDRDYFLPFRQLGPSKRITLNDPNGPFCPTRLKTREGLFDALIFRLITQASPFLLQDKHVHFGSPSNFEEATVGLDRSHYCKKNATGQHCRFLNIPYIQTYWDNSAGWSDCINQPDFTFESLRLWLTGNQGGKTRFFGMGNLVGWLLATDYVYAGLVEMPEAREVGEIIYRINAGGRAGLKLLGFDVSTKEGCADAMDRVWAKVCKCLTPSEVQQMGLDQITLEHALCKFSRLFKGYIVKVG